MAFFKLRKAAGESAAPAPAPESVDALRRRARYRLAGAAILVLAGVVGFPLLFDNQPRPIAVDIPIDIPDKAKVKPLAMGHTAADGKRLEGTAESAATAVAAASQTATGQALAPAKDAKQQAQEQPKEEVIISSSKPADKSSDKADEKTAATPEAKTDPKASDKKADKPADSMGRFVVQFGAFGDSALAQEARLKVERTGLKTYAQVAETPGGKKIRVRVGPFEKRSDAEKAADKIKKIGLPAAILGL